MSSAILYLAIVAIWAVVLVPRWLRPRQAQPHPVPVPVPGSASAPASGEPTDAEWHEPAAPDQDTDVRTDAVGEATAGEPVAGAGAAAAGGANAGGADAEDEAGEAAVPSPATRRAEVLKARRRLLTTLVTLTVIAAALVVTGIDAYWIVIPPAVLLGGYLTLLRKFVRIDAERARRAARIRHAAARARAEQENAASREPVPVRADAVEPDLGPASGAPVVPDGAEIIDISGRIGDQVYDQYTDAANRAVGD